MAYESGLPQARELRLVVGAGLEGHQAAGLFAAEVEAGVADVADGWAHGGKMGKWVGKGKLGWLGNSFIWQKHYLCGMRKTITEINVRGYHSDLYGHVNNARYLEFLEEARWRHYEGVVDLNEFKENGWAFVVVNINISYRHPAVPGDVVVIEVAVQQVNSRSVVIHQDLRLKSTGKLVAEADVTFVILDAVKGGVVPIQGHLKEVLIEKTGLHDVA